MDVVSPEEIAGVRCKVLENACQLIEEAEILHRKAHNGFRDRDVLRLRLVRPQW